MVTRCHECSGMGVAGLPQLLSEVDMGLLSPLGAAPWLAPTMQPGRATAQVSRRREMDSAGSASRSQSWKTSSRATPIVDCRKRDPLKDDLLW